MPRGVDRSNVEATNGLKLSIFSFWENHFIFVAARLKLFSEWILSTHQNGTTENCLWPNGAAPFASYFRFVVTVGHTLLFAFCFVVSCCISSPFSKEKWILRKREKCLSWKVGTGPLRSVVFFISLSLSLSLSLSQFLRLEREKAELNL